MATVALFGDAQQLPGDRSRSGADAGVIYGRVIGEENNPLHNARVAIASADKRTAPVLTDGDGRFALPVRSDAPQMIVVSKTGYVTTRVAAAAGDVRLTKGGAIAGIVLDDYGAPVPLVRAVAERRVLVNGRTTFERQGSADTDDTGRFRLFGLGAGEYVVGVSGVRMIWAAGRPPIPVAADAPPREYFPNASRADAAQLIEVSAGAEVSGINFTIQIPPPPVSSAAPNQPQRRAAAVIRGRILRADGLPLKRARVELSSADRLFAPIFTLADDDGRYEFMDVATGRYLVAATGPGFTMGTYRQRHASDRGDTIVVAAGGTADRIDLSVPATSAIVGRIIDENGEPVEGANVRVEQVRWSAGRRRLENVAGIASRQTDDLGRYRIFGLLPGPYVVGAVVGQPVAGYEPNDLPGYVKTYYPGSFVVSDAQNVDVASGQDTLNVEFAIVRGQAGSISGRVVTAAGRPFAGAVHLVASSRSRAVASASLRVRTEDATFRFDHLAPGEYVVQAATARESPSVEGEFGMQFVTASSSPLDDVVVRMSSGSSITGRIVFEGGSPPPQAEIRLSPVPADVDFTSLADNPVARARVHDNWTFEMGGVNGPRRLQLLQAPEGWMLSRISVNGADVIDAPLVFGTSEQSLSDVEVVLTNRLTGVTGIVTGDRTRPTAGALVVAFATDRTLWYAQTRYIAHGDTSDSGMFTLTVPPGSYYVAALDARDAPENIDDIANPDFLAALSTDATRLTVGEGEMATARLRVSAR